MFYNICTFQVCSSYPAVLRMAWRFSFTLYPPSVLSLVQFNTHLKRSHKQTSVYSTNQTLTVAGLGTVVAIQGVASLKCFVSSLLLCSLVSFYSSSVCFFFIKVPLTLSLLMSYIYITHRSANLQTLHINIYSTNTLTEYFKHAAHSLFFSFQNAVCFIMIPFFC